MIGKKMNQNDLNKLILEWAEQKGIMQKGTTIGQAIKTAEETNELLLATHNKDSAEIKDAIGDIYVTIAIQAEMNNLTMDECIESAYDVIAKRTGKMINGQFVKD